MLSFRLRAISLLPLLTLFASGSRGQATASQAPHAAPSFRVLVLAEHGGVHQPFVDAARVWLAEEAVADNFVIDELENTDRITDSFLAAHRLFIQLNYPPYNWTPVAQAAFMRYIDEGRGGWIGFHHATLLGEFDGFPLWPWFSDFMGGIRFRSYIPDFATATVHVADRSHPVMRGVPAIFPVANEEWYTWDKSPSPNVHVLATVDESTYTPDRPQKMGADHPVIWSNEHKRARNVYIFMGHHPELLDDRNFTALFHNAILWASSK